MKTIISMNGVFYFAMTQGAGHFTNDRSKAFKFATQEAAQNYIDKKLKAYPAQLQTEPATK